jgi:hypothetical protein
MSKYYAKYLKGEVIYAEQDGRVLVDKRPAQVDPGYMVMPDIQPYQSMIDGSMIQSRSRHREHLKDHGCIEVGNEIQKPKPIRPPPGLKETLIRVVNEKVRS